MKSKYFDELGLSEYPYPYNQPDYPDTDKRDTYALDTTFVAWWYERLCLYRDINCIDTSYHKFEIDGETLTFGQCIDRMIEDCKGLLQQLDKSFFVVDDELKDDLFKVLKECFWCLWW